MSVVSSVNYSTLLGASRSLIPASTVRNDSDRTKLDEEALE